MGIRARTESDKSARREAILAVVTSSLESRPLTGVTMAEIAQRCGLAKGTLYLYYETKEELFLATLESELTAWYEAIAVEMRSRDAVDAASFAKTVVKTLAGRRALVDLLPQLRPILDVPTLPTRTAARFREHTRDGLAVAAEAVESALALPRGAGVSVMMRTQALVSGLRQFPDMGDGVREPAPANGPVPSAFERELMSSITAMVRGMVGAYA
jgi:AcrR family transcriptional regulator